MKIKKHIIIFFIVFVIFISGCLPLPTEPMEDPGAKETQEEATLQAKFQEAETSTAVYKTSSAEETAVFETSVAKEMTKQAPPPTATYTATPEFTDTPTPTETPRFTSTPTTDPNPWVMQDWCLDHKGCVPFRVYNRQSDWVKVQLTYLETGFIQFWSIRPNGQATITLRPGEYSYEFKSCGGDKINSGIHVLNENWYLTFRSSMCN